MVDILIRNVRPQTRERLRRNAKKRGKSLEAYLRSVLEQLVGLEMVDKPPAKIGFGTWLAAVSRPGADIRQGLSLLRSARLRRPDWLDEG